MRGVAWKNLHSGERGKKYPYFLRQEQLVAIWGGKNWRGGLKEGRKKG